MSENTGSGEWQLQQIQPTRLTSDFEQQQPASYSLLPSPAVHLVFRSTSQVIHRSAYAAFSRGEINGQIVHVHTRHLMLQVSKHLPRERLQMSAIGFEVQPRRAHLRPFSMPIRSIWRVLSLPLYEYSIGSGLLQRIGVLRQPLFIAALNTL